MTFKLDSTFSKSLKPRAVEEWLDTYFFRRLAHLLVPLFLKFNISPNTVTSLSLTTGLIASIFLFKRQFIIFGILALAAIVLDCCDGQVARLSGKTSSIGRILDGICDMIWIVVYWVLIYRMDLLHNAHLSHPLLFLSLGGASMILHCWRFDGIKIRYLELTQPQFSEKDMDLSEATHLMKTSFKKGQIFVAFLAFCMAFQMYLFVRGAQKKEKINLNEAQIKKNSQKLDPIMRRWAWLGESHHNVWMILGIFFLPLTPFVLVFAVGVILIGMNIWWALGEIYWRRALNSITSETI